MGKVAVPGKSGCWWEKVAVDPRKVSCALTPNLWVLVKVGLRSGKAVGPRKSLRGKGIRLFGYS